MSGPVAALVAAPVVAIVQARMTSTRLPGKVLKEICGTTILGHVLARLGGANRIDKLVVATSTDSTDDVIEQWCRDNGQEVSRGSLDDVLDRYYGAAVETGAAIVVRITADCPLIDPQIVDSVIELLLSGGHDYASLGGDFPDGLDCEAFTFETLKRAHAEAKLASEHEHVTPYIYKNPDRFDIATVTLEGGNAQLRWTVDDEKDFSLVTHIFEGLSGTDADKLFYTGDILEFLRKNPELSSINSETIRNEGYAKSIREDHEV
ncbi:MAG: glycosyltransferase family protein [Proteobacteria bacterium]|nr:glycosyltransferase family protein [Pseudomonadota bacterium]